ncbi:hypothetical protein ACFE04_011314 [Oxalis oulophora]
MKLMNPSQPIAPTHLYGITPTKPTHLDYSDETQKLILKHKPPIKTLSLVLFVLLVLVPVINQDKELRVKSNRVLCVGGFLETSKFSTAGNNVTMTARLSSDNSAPAAFDNTAPPKPWLIVGLGNPGKKYQSTRHKVGFEMVDAIVEAQDIFMTSVSFKALFGKGWMWSVFTSLWFVSFRTTKESLQNSFKDFVQLLESVLRMQNALVSLSIW